MFRNFFKFNSPYVLALQQNIAKNGPLADQDLKNNPLTRVFDQVELQESDLKYFKEKMKKIFSTQMTGSEPVEVSIEKITALQAIIRKRVNKVLFSEIGMMEELDKIPDERKRAECVRDITVAFANKYSGQVNMEGRQIALKGTPAQNQNAAVYMNFVNLIIRYYDKSPEQALEAIRQYARQEIKKGILREMRIIIDNHNQCLLPADVIIQINEFDVKEKILNSTEKKVLFNLPLLNDRTDSSLKTIFAEAVRVIYISLGKTDPAKAREFLNLLEDKLMRKQVLQMGGVSFEDPALTLSYSLASSSSFSAASAAAMPLASSSSSSLPPLSSSSSPSPLSLSSSSLDDPTSDDASSIKKLKR